MQRNSVRPLQQNCHPDRSEAQWRDLLFLSSTSNSHLSYPSPLVIPSEAEGSAVRPAALSHLPWEAIRTNQFLRFYP